jgi:hypothetical protein
MNIRRLRRKSGNTVVSVWPPPCAFSLETRWRLAGWVSSNPFRSLWIPWFLTMKSNGARVHRSVQWARRHQWSRSRGLYANARSADHDHR